MDSKSRDRFEEITSKEVEALTPGDIDFLRARSSYLSSDQREKYRVVLLLDLALPAPRSKKSE
jgi:hypothetical protein